MNNRLDAVLEVKRAKGEKTLVLFVTAGFPDWDRSEEIITTLAESGCDILELGVPFSDPIADGATIQRTSQRALEAGVTLRGILELVRRVRARTEMPIVLFSALNPLMKFGIGDLARECRAVGVDGILCPDLPPEEAGELKDACAREGLSTIFLVAPTTLQERQKFIAESCTGFVYYVSLKGVTGARAELSADLADHVKALKALTPKPLMVGFGISRPEHVRQVVASGADGVVVGSALLNLIEKHEDSPDLLREVGQYVKSLCGGLGGGE